MSADDDDYELILWYACPTKGIKPYFQLGTVSDFLTIGNL